MYFKSETMFKGLEKKRGWYAELTVDKADGTERVLAGVICKLPKGAWAINEGDVDDCHFRTIPLSRVKSVFIDGITIKPKRKEPEYTSQEDLDSDIQIQQAMLLEKQRSN